MSSLKSQYRKLTQAELAFHGRLKAHYVAVYRHPDGDSRQTLLRRVILDVPFGLVTPPTITLHEPLVGAHEFTHCGGGSQAEIARLYAVTQQSIGRWIKYTEGVDR